MSKRQSNLKKLIKLTLGLVRSSRIARYSCKYSKKTFTQHQLIVLCVLRVYFKMDYRSFADLVLFSNDLFYLLKLKRRPHFTTLQKFLQRFGSQLLDFIIESMSYQLKRVDAAIDSSGFTSSYSSRYYVMRVNRDTSYRSFMKMSIVVDPKRKLLLGVKCRKGPAHDTRDFIPLLRRIKCRFRNVLADAAYDSCKNFSFVEKELGATPVIPVRVYSSYKPGRNGIRRHRPLITNKGIYSRRNLAETVFSVIKRKFGGDLSSRLTEVKKKEMKLKALTYNLLVLNDDRSYFILVRISTEPPYQKLYIEVLSHNKQDSSLKIQQFQTAK